MQGSSRSGGSFSRKGDQNSCAKSSECKKGECGFEEMRVQSDNGDVSAGGERGVACGQASQAMGYRTQEEQGAKRDSPWTLVDWRGRLRAFKH